jgi:prepilin-type N-terminal cleavage/methylation domain-containing protein
MRGVPRQSRQNGFTLLELMVALSIFLLICCAAFTLLGTSQRRSQTDSQLLTSFQEARLGLDQIVRDVNNAGYPPPTYRDGFPADSASSPFGWSPGYTVIPPAPCAIGTGGGGTCISPGDFDLIVETNPDPNPQLNKTVQWIRYSLVGTTLMRGTAPKTAGGDPWVNTNGTLVPFVQNVANNSTPAQIAQYQAAYPTMFPVGAPVPIFSYFCDSAAPPPPTVSCPAVAGAPANIRDVIITLIVASPLPDATTGQPRLVQLTGRGRRVNPNQ